MTPPRSVTQPRNVTQSRSVTSFLDAVGVAHEPAGQDARIVCLVPSVTELLCDLGLAEQLVGRTGFCIHPWETVREIPKLGGTKDVKLETLRALEPTHVVVNVDENRRETVQEIAAFVPNVIVTHPQAPRDNLDLYKLLGGIFQRQREAQHLCNAFEEAWEAAIAGAAAREPSDVLYLIWREPWMTIAPDTYISQMLAAFGWHTLPEVSEERYPTIDLAALAGEVDYVLLSSEPFHFKERHVPEVESLVPGAKVSLIDGEMTSWYGSRAIEGLRYLADYTRDRKRPAEGPASNRV